MRQECSIYPGLGAKQEEKGKHILDVGKIFFMATAWLLASCLSSILAATLCLYKYFPDMTKQSCSQRKYRERKLHLLLCHPLMMLCEECALITAKNLPDLPLTE